MGADAAAVGQARPTLFLSDLHLSPARQDALAAFHAFAAGPARDAAAVYILGDLFDWWIGDDQMREPFVAQVVASLAALRTAGVPLYVGRGNRDFLLGERFAAATGARLLPECEVIDAGGVRTLVSHGDELCTEDIQYQEYRARVRSAEMQARLLRLPYFARRMLAWWLRRKSGNDKSLKAESIMDVSDGAVAAAFRAHGVVRMVHGHTHRPARHVHVVDGAPRERHVLADWHDHGSYLAADADGIHAREIRGAGR